MNLGNRVGISLMVGLTLLFSGCSKPASEGRKVIVLGIDGMDHGLTQQFIEAGKMPGFERLAQQGSFAPLGTSVPPLSPVAWSDFITGTDSGGHGIYDFIHRDPETMIPFLSTSRAEDAAKFLELGDWKIPLGGGDIELLRRGRAFWEDLEDNGVETTIVRMPANFPPTGTASRELSGMGTPDMLGSYGQFSFYTSVLFAFAGQDIGGGEVFEAWEEDGVVQATLMGPENAFLAKPKRTEVDFKVYIDPEENFGKLEIGTETRLLEVGKWSDWVVVDFELIPSQTVRGICRFYLRSVRPEFELYVSPLNFDPMAPGMPISSPDDYSAELAKGSGRFFTQGMPEEQRALRERVITRDEFLSQAKIAGDEVRHQYGYVLDDFLSEQSGDRFLFYYFGNLDQVSHMMYRAIDPEHPLYDAEQDSPYERVIEGLYRQADQVISDTLDSIDDDTLLVVMSDHGFSPFRRKFSLSYWLKEHGYLTVKNPQLKNDPGLFGNVDWSKTRAYACGLNGLYVNLAGREKHGIVDPSEHASLLREIADKLTATIDPATGLPAVGKAYVTSEYFRFREHTEYAPDIVVGFAYGTGGSDETALGGIDTEMFKDNADEWSGDHGMDHEVVPGILLTNRNLKQPASDLKSLAASLLNEYGLEGFPPTQPAH